MGGLNMSDYISREAMSETPKCPGCGADMELMHLLCNATFYYVCPKCGWGSPVGVDPESAFRMAMCRAEPKNRVLTLDEIREMQDNNQCNWVLIWVEIQSEINTKEYCLVQGCIQYIVDNEFSFVYPAWEGNDLFRAEVYKKTWRCWLRRPTEKERETVLWEK